jgi:hypothetical protein
MELNNETQTLTTVIHGQDRCYALDTKVSGPRDELGAIAKLKAYGFDTHCSTAKMEVAGVHGTRSYQATRRHMPADHTRQKISVPARVIKLDMSVVRLVAYFLSCPGSHRVERK